MSISPCSLDTYSISSEGEELISRGTTQFPIAFYHDDLEHMSVVWHWHDELECIYVEHGETTLFAGREKYSLHEGQALFINSNVMHAARGVRGTGCRFHSMVFSPRLIAGGLDSVYWEKYLQPIIKNGPRSLVFDGRQPWHAKAQEEIEAAWQEGAANEPGFEFRVRNHLSELIFLIYSNHPVALLKNSPKNLRDSARIRQMLQFIIENYAEPLTIEEIAASASLSESECLRCFRSTIELSPIQYLKRYRILKASEMLAGTGKKISDIALECGFSDPSYFNRAFKAERGVTPKEYRAKRQEEAARQSSLLGALQSSLAAGNLTAGSLAAGSPGAGSPAAGSPGADDEKTPGPEGAGPEPQYVLPVRIRLKD